jgi:hypothetical protein
MSPLSMMTSPKFTQCGIRSGFPQVRWYFALLSALDFDRTAHRIDHIAEFCKHSVASALDNPTAMFSDFGIDENAQMFLYSDERVLLGPAGQPTVASDIGRENGR